MCRRKSDPPRPCGKRKLTERKARGVVQAARRSGCEHRQECRVYYCKGCQAHHTTSAPFTTLAQRRQQPRA